MLSDAMSMRRCAVAVVAVACSLAVAGCESGRFGGGPRGAATQPRAEAPVEPIAPSVPSGSVTAEPLAPPSGGPTEIPPVASSPQPVPTLGGGGGGAAAPASRSTAVGSWNAREASGTCKINLSSTPSLDLYRASAGGCANKELSRVTSWDFRDGEVYLFQPGGAVAARLRPGSGGLTGVLAKSGAPLTLSRS